MSDERREPQPLKRFQITLGGALLFLTGSAIGTIVLVNGTPRMTAGARSSTRLQWQQRADEIDDAAARAAAEGPRLSNDARE